MADAQALARAVIAALVEFEATPCHWWGAMTPEERERAEARCAAAAVVVERESVGG